MSQRIALATGPKRSPSLPVGAGRYPGKPGAGAVPRGHPTPGSHVGATSQAGTPPGVGECQQEWIVPSALISPLCAARPVLDWQASVWLPWVRRAVVGSEVLAAGCC